MQHMTVVGQFFPSLLDSLSTSFFCQRSVSLLSKKYFVQLFVTHYILLSTLFTPFCIFFPSKQELFPSKIQNLKKS